MDKHRRSCNVLLFIYTTGQTEANKDMSSNLPQGSHRQLSPVEKPSRQPQLDEVHRRTRPFCCGPDDQPDWDPDQLLGCAPAGPTPRCHPDPHTSSEFYLERKNKRVKQSQNVIAFFHYSYGINRRVLCRLLIVLFVQFTQQLKACYINTLLKTIYYYCWARNC